ncbi:MAG: hormogonium polysaccharide secretion pseudopilin HpsC [Actinomycetota bacterium]
MNSLLRLLLKNQQKCRDSQETQSSGGFTMVELLVGMIMAFLILTPLFAFVIDILNNDRREQTKAVSEQEVQAAIDFMAQDLQQAIYIYDQAGINTIRNYLPEPGNTKRTPKLVFWKRQLVKDVLPVANCTASATEDCLNDTYVFSLVAYYVFTDKDTTWCQPDSAEGSCPQRIARYEVRDGVKDPTDSTKYLCDTITGGCPTASDIRKKDDAFNPKVDLTNPTNTTAPSQPTLGANFKAPNILANYIFDFPAPVVTNNNLAKVSLIANALRRSDTNATTCPTPPASPSAYCPTVTIQVQGRGGLGK